MICIYTRLHAFASLSGVFSLFSPLNIYISLFSVCLISPCSLPAAVSSLRSPPPPLPRRVAIRALLSSLPPLLLLPCVPWLPCRLSPSGAPLKLSGGLPSCLLCLVVLWWLPLLVRYQAQNGVTVWADAARIYPRPCLLLPMCCRVFRCPFRGFRVCVLLPAVFWWQ